MTETRQDADVAFIRALAELLRDNDLSEVEVKREYGEDGRLNVRVSRYKAPPAAAALPATSVALPPVGPSPVAIAAPEQPEDPARHPGAVTSPMVGTVYMQAEPGSDPFVSVGAQVTEGQTLVIVEAMKTMNHIPAPRAGIVRRILVEDGAAVEYGTPLVIVE